MKLNHLYKVPTRSKIVDDLVKNVETPHPRQQRKSVYFHRPESEDTRKGFCVYRLLRLGPNGKGSR